MKSNDDRRVSLKAGLVAASLATLSVVSAPLVAERREAVPTAPVSGPAADYPMVLGAPFTVDGKTYTPADMLNIDQVGYATTGAEGGGGISLAHRTLPLPSYVEVTSLKTGRTILVRVERRGPMSGSALVELSPGAGAQLGVASPREPVRVRRVNPPEAERALLRAGQTAPARMDTPMSLVNVLLRKLDPALAPPPAPLPATVPADTAPVVAGPLKPDTVVKPGPVAKPVAAAKPAVPAKPAVLPKPAVAAAPAKAPPAPATVKPEPAPKAPAAKLATAPTAAHSGAYVVQVGAFSSEANAARAARQVGGTASPAGKFHRVRIGGFASPAEARAALAKAKAAGYTDARIQRAD